MPIECYYRDEGGETHKIDTTEPGQVFFFYDFDDGQLARIIGIESPGHDVGGNIHVIDDDEILATACPSNIAERFTEETIHEWMPPNSRVFIETNDRDGKCVRFIMDHTLPHTTSLN